MISKALGCFRHWERTRANIAPVPSNVYIAIAGSAADATPSPATPCVPATATSDDKDGSKLAELISLSQEGGTEAPQPPAAQQQQEAGEANVDE